MSEIHRFFATTAKGMEALLSDELQSFGSSNLEVTRAGVYFSGTLEVAYRACLWSRIANRILLPLKKFPAPTPEKLYGGVKSIKWSDHLSYKNTLAVDFSMPVGVEVERKEVRGPSRPAAGGGIRRRPGAPGSEAKITHTHFGALKVKDAIVDQLRSVQGDRPSIDPATPDVRVNVYYSAEEAVVSIDLSGSSLHLRGYREEGALAPLKENLAAAILMLAGWPAVAREGGEFIDPMCGSGTLPIEAAMMAADLAPGLNRKYFGFLNWSGHDPQVWKRLVEEAQDREIKDRKKLPRITGYDADFRPVRAALANIERSGMHGKVHIEKRDYSLATPTDERGIIIVNPPYGERLGEVEELKPLYRGLGDLFKKQFKGWGGYIFTGSPELSKEVGLKASRRFVLFNGPIECRLLKYELFEGSKKTPKVDS